MRRLFGLGLGLLFVLWPTLLFAAEARQGIVVWRIEKKAGVTEQDIDSLSGYIASEVERASGLHAISDSDIATILKGEQTKQQCGGEASSCVAEIGAALGVPLAVAGDLGKVDKYWFLNIKLINVHSAQVEKRVSRKLSGSLGDLIDALPGAISELFKDKQGKAPAKAAAPLVAPAQSAAPTTPPVVAEKPVPEPKAEPAPPAAPAKPMSTLNKAAFACFFSGVGLAVVGGISHWQMGKAKDSYEASRGADSGAKSRHSTFKALTYVGYGLGGAGMVTGAVLWIVDATRKPKPESAAVSLGVAPGPNGASVTLVGRW